MPSKNFTLDSGLDITVYKRQTSRHLRLSIGPSGEVRVSIPRWVPYAAGLEFAKAREAWIREQHRPAGPLRHGQAVGKGHHLQFVAKPNLAKASSRVRGTDVLISYPAGADPASPPIQKIAQEACIRSLRLQAQQLLPQRLAALADKHSFDYKSVTVKRLKSRWGSCDQQTHIVLNLFLMQLPWELIDYVLLHELTHTRILRHGADFWRTLRTVSPEAPALKRRLREYQPVLLAE